MNHATRKRLIVIALIAFYVAMGFFREFVFLNINEQSRVTYYHETDSHVSASMQWLSNFSYPALYYSKWPLTLAFTVFFAFLAGKTMFVAFGEKNLIRITWIVYSITFVTGLLFFLAGSLLGNSETTYDIARFLAGLTETPAMLVILLASFLAIRRR